MRAFQFWQFAGALGFCNHRFFLGKIMLSYRVMYQQGQALRHGALELIASWQQSSDARIWLDVTVMLDEYDSEHLESQLNADLAVFGCHPLALQDALDSRQPPKIEAFSQHLLFIYRDIVRAEEVLQFGYQSVNLLVGKRFLISIHRGDNARIDKIAGEPEHIGSNPLSWALKIMRASSDAYLHHVAEFESSLSTLEDKLNQQDDERHMLQLNGYRSKLIKLKRLFNYHENITLQLQNDSDYQTWLADANIEHEVTDLHDHFERLNSVTQLYYQICSDLLDAFLSLSSYRLNINMRLLTVITAIFVPLSFLAGLYGMNFAYMPELQYHWGYFILLGVMASIATGMLWFFKKRQWL